MSTLCVHLIQGSSTEVLPAALTRLPECLRRRDAHLYNHVHDEVIIDATQHSTNDAILSLQQAMRLGFLDVFPDAGLVINDVVEVKRASFEI